MPPPMPGHPTNVLHRNRLPRDPLACRSLRVLPATVIVDSPTSLDPATPRRSGLWRWLLALLLVAGIAAALGWRGWTWLQAREQMARQADQQQFDAFRQRLDSLRRDQRIQSQRLQQADATNRLLRDELLGLGQRAGLLEDSLHKLANPDRHGVQALRLDEVELLLSQGMQRLQLAGDLDGARRAYALAAGVLDGIDDPAWLSLRQTLVQERATLDALGADPKIAAVAGLDALAGTLTTPTGAATTHMPVQMPWWERTFRRLVQVQPSEGVALPGTQDQVAGFAALELEMAMARAAAERRDSTGYHAALDRAARWLPRLWPDTPQRRQWQRQITRLRALPLQLDVPTLGSSLQQLRSMRSNG